MGTSKVNAGGNTAMDLHPIKGGVEIPLAALCCRNRDNWKPWSDGPLGLHVDLILRYHDLLF